MPVPLHVLPAESTDFGIMIKPAAATKQTTSMPLRFLLYPLCQVFFIDLPEDGLNTGRNMSRTYKGNQMN
jgi:hypothetical protein